MSVFPATRLRRFRRTDALRDLVREARVDVRDLVYPLFVCPGTDVERPLEGLDGIDFVRFGGEDVVRHKLVQRIVAAYNEYAEQQAPALRGPRRQAGPHHRGTGSADGFFDAGGTIGTAGQ